MASTNCYTVNIHSYRFCVSYIGVSVSRVGPTRTAYSIFFIYTYNVTQHTRTVRSTRELGTLGPMLKKLPEVHRL